ncbi:tyrosine-type recombinase/integrase [Agrobacterium vitis]|uniref:Tyrosine-type recombinase/integrase n=1 Tax=Agrobacterium vitis TaxID=373 RepID=A0AAE5AXS8_AGRVI|nr:tyrosine-type recombinase/integrase [Agrobacterium vitis]MCF1501215.1 tyrosine-type recombinase/integrase [Allorhizobium sp. Av2]MCM2440574.1 tyrosine-type recombinase/integrase [Agrobacterium vitis]MUZ59560.1 tyrosine-type recombinase/integrase [Agrobacterium vitis]MVA66677.1 tyrosine-type recombinase/integrase [Agrobacterium vitis]MVA87540.1 tyrosine-type recombinase/integrase [Agrobacterium vitis]
MKQERIRRENRYKGWKIFQDKKPPFKWRAYHRTSGKKIDCDQFQPYTLAFDMEIHRLNEAMKEHEAKPGTLGMLIALYRKTVFTSGDLAARTISDYESKFEYLRPISDVALTKFDTPLIVKIRDKARLSKKDHFANYLVRVLSLLFAWGKERGYVKDNPAAGLKAIRRRRGQADANRPWTDAERHAVVAALPPHMRLPMALMMFYGLDPQDALGLPRSAISNGRINTRRGKTEEPVFLPLVDPVKAALEEAPAHDAITLCATMRGRPWTYNGFSTNWAKIKARLEKEGLVQPGLTLKGLRHTVATILREMGQDYGAIQLVLGHKTEAMARHYSKRADMSHKTQATVTSLEAEMNRRKTKPVKPAD